MPTGPLLVHRFQLKNEGRTALDITSLESGCGCLNPEVDKKHAEPGETIVATATVNTLTQSAGRRTWRTLLRYRTASGAEGSVALTLGGEIVPLFSVSPPQVAFSTATTAKQTFVVEQVGGQPFQIVGLRSTRPYLAVVAGTGGSFEVELKSDAPVGVSDEFVLVSVDHPLCKELRIPIKVLKRAANGVTVSPEQPAVRFAAGAEEASTLVQLRSPIGKPLRILEAKADHPSVTLRYASGSVGPALNLRIVVKATVAGKATITLKLNEETISIPLTWTMP